MKNFNQWLRENLDNPDHDGSDLLNRSLRNKIPDEFPTIPKNFPTGQMPNVYARKLANLLGCRTLLDLSNWSIEDMKAANTGTRFLTRETLEFIREFLKKAGLELRDDLGGFKSN